MLPSWSSSVEGDSRFPVSVFRERLDVRALSNSTDNIFQRHRCAPRRAVPVPQDAVDGAGKGSRLIRINPTHCKVQGALKSLEHLASCTAAPRIRVWENLIGLQGVNRCKILSICRWRCHQQLESAFQWAAWKASPVRCF